MVNLRIMSNQIEELSKSSITIGVIADTHVPERVRKLNPKIFAIFQDANVDLIFHAGDISVPYVLDQLSSIAPVTAVAGNRDILLWKKLPMRIRTEYFGIKIGMTHGHDGLWQYLQDKVFLSFRRYHHKYFYPRLFKNFPDQKIIIFGHGHLPLNHWLNGKLLFNPGSPHVPDKEYPIPTVGLLSIKSTGVIKGKIIPLNTND